MNFVIYNYNFARIIEPQKQFQIEFPDWENVDIEDSFKNKQSILNEFLINDYSSPFQFENAKKKTYWHKQIVKPQDDLYVMRVANITNVTITDENLKNKDYKDYRNCLVIIDNRTGIQRIAIEKKTNAFNTTTTVANIIEATFNKFLKYKMLKVKLSAVYGTNVFWSTVSDHPNGFTKVYFHFPHLNLERLTKVMDKYLMAAREDWDSDLDFSFGANEGGVVNIDPNNERQKALINGASAAGAWIGMQPKGEKKKIFCGKNQHVEQTIDSDIFDDLVSDKQYIPNMSATPMDKIKIFMNNIPNVFTSSTTTY